MARKNVKKMQLFLVRANEMGDEVFLCASEPGDIGDKTVRAIVDKQGPGEYRIITGRARTAKLSKREVTEFSLE